MSAAASSGLSVSFSVGSTNQCTIGGNIVTITGAGSCTVTASQGGDSNYNAATSVPWFSTIANGTAAVPAAVPVAVPGAVPGAVPAAAPAASPAAVPAAAQPSVNTVLLPNVSPGAVAQATVLALNGDTMAVNVYVPDGQPPVAVVAQANNDGTVSYAATGSPGGTFYIWGGDSGWQQVSIPVS